MSPDTTRDERGDTGRASASDNDADGADSSETQKNVLEWSVMLLGAAIVLFTFGYLTYKLIGGADAPPDLRIALGEPETSMNPDSTRAQVLVPVELTNRGGLVAQKATVEVCAGRECAQLDFPFVPHGAVRKGQLGFNAPLAGPLRARIVSYRE